MNTKNAIEPELLGAEQGAVVLGVSLSTFRRLCFQPDFPRSMLIGGRLRKWHRARLMEWAGGMTAERGGKLIQLR